MKVDRVPTIIKSTSNIAKLGDLGTYSISTSATPHDTSDSSGAVPTVSVTMADGEDSDYLIGEALTLQNPAIGKYSGEIVEVSDSSNSGRYTMNAETIISRLNSDQRLYPSHTRYSPTLRQPLAALEYWSQQCGIFYDGMEGDVLFYMSQFYHWFAYVKGSNRPIRGENIVAAGTPGEEVDNSPTLGGRNVTTFGRNRNLIVRFPATEPLPVQVPGVGDPRVLVFSSGIYNQGTERRAAITWEFMTPTKKKACVKVIIDSAAGVSLQARNGTAPFTTLGTVEAAVNGNYRVNVGIKSFSATETTFLLSVLDPSGQVLGSATQNMASDLAGNLSLTSVNFRGEDQGSGEPQLHWGDTLSVMDAMPSKRPSDQKSLSSGTKAAQIFVGFSGNVWEHFKAYCSIYNLDVSYIDGKLTIGPRQTAPTYVAKLGTLSRRITKRDQARFVEVVNRNSVPTLSMSGFVPQVMWKADTVYQVAVGETQEFLVQTDHSILEVSQPVAVSGINPFPYKIGTGQYVVTGSDGYIVSPTFWRDQGGKITVDTTENEGEIKVTIKGPNFDSPRAPYRISEGDAGRPALYITGLGVINTPKTLKVSTGNTKAAKEIGVTLDSPFIINTAVAYDVASRAAQKFATPDVQVTVTEALDYDSPSDLGVAPAGQLIKRDGNILRITEATQSPAGISATATQYNTIAQVKKSFGPATIGQVKAYREGKTIGQTNIKPLKVVK